MPKEGVTQATLVSRAARRKKKSPRKILFLYLHIVAAFRIAFKTVGKLQ